MVGTQQVSVEWRDLPRFSDNHILGHSGKLSVVKTQWLKAGPVENDIDDLVTFGQAHLKDDSHKTVNIVFCPKKS